MSRWTIAWFCLGALAGLAGCATGPEPAHVRAADLSQTSFDTAASSPDSSERLLLRTASLRLEVSEPEPTAAAVVRLVESVGGYVENSNANERRVWMRVRLPARDLDAVMAEAASLGEAKHRSVEASDVTDQVADLEARLRSDRALRERLVKLLERAESVEDVLAIEKELGRLQSKIETMESRLERLRKDVAMSTLTVEIEQTRILGPLGVLGEGMVWALSKLFVIR